VCIVLIAWPLLKRLRAFSRPLSAVIAALGLIWFVLRLR
jgi:hypothetical protein